MKFSTVFFGLLLPVTGAVDYGWYYSATSCTGPHTDQYQMRDNGECMPDLGAYGGALWINGQMGANTKEVNPRCLYMYEADECTGYTAAWQFNSKFVCYTMPYVEGHTFKSYRYVPGACFEEREVKPISNCSRGHDGKNFYGSGECMEEPSADELDTDG